MVELGVLDVRKQRWGSWGYEQKVGVLREVRTGFFDNVRRDEEALGVRREALLGVWRDEGLFGVQSDRLLRV